MATKLIAVSEKNYDELLELGKMHSTFNDVISILLEQNKKVTVQQTPKGIVIGAETK